MVRLPHLHVAAVQGSWRRGLNLTRSLTLDLSTRGCLLHHVGVLLATLHLGHSVVVVVASKKLLHLRVLQLLNILQHLFCVGVLPFTVRVFEIEVVFIRVWHKWRRQHLVIKGVPVIILKPNMILDFLRPVVTKA